jgi:phosphoglucomutase
MSDLRQSDIFRYMMKIKKGKDEMNIKSNYKKWLEAAGNTDLKRQLIAMPEPEINDAFYRDLEFGTGGLRGIMGAGTNRMNVYTVCRATQGLCNYLKSQNKLSSVAIAYDSRIKSEIFARAAAGVIAANGATANIFSELMPTPVLSYTVRELACDAGIVITASHNPAEYNGYKVYGSDGCQITLQMAQAIQKHIDAVDVFAYAEEIPFERAVQKGRVHFIPPEILESYLDQVEHCSINPKLLKESDLKVIYTPLNGAGNKPVREILRKAGLKCLTVVPEQEKPDGRFPTCHKPNPEEPSAFELAIALAEKTQADLLLATDPDGDRVGAAVKYGHGYRQLTGNETGCLLLNYILSQKKAKNMLPERPVIIKTIVTSAMADMIAGEYGARVIDTLTGFKYIGDQIGVLERRNEESSYIFGFEESYGYLPEVFVRDKDAVSASLLICEMAAYYKKNRSTLLEELEKLYKQHGYWKHKLLSFTLQGSGSNKTMNPIMNVFRKGTFSEYAEMSIIKTDDYLNSVSLNKQTGNKTSLLLPRSDVLVFSLENNCEIVIRPSGTEPKIKCYLTVRAKDSFSAIQMLDALEADVTSKIKSL